MAGSDSAFDTDEVRTALRAAMTIGLAPEVEARPTFGWDRDNTYASHDSGGHPWGPSQTATATGTTRPTVQVPVAVDAQPVPGRPTDAGVIDADILNLTFLDEDWAQVEGFDWMTVGVGSSRRIYRFSKMLPPIGLFDLGVVQIQVVSAG